MNKKIKTFTLEFIVEDKTYWLTSGDGIAEWIFSEIPLSVFDGHELFYQCVMKDVPYSFMYEFENQMFEFQSNDDAEIQVFKDVKNETLTWNEMAALLVEKNQLDLALFLYYGNWVFKKENCSYGIPNGPYKVVAFCPDLGKCCLMHRDYGPPNNTNCVTFDLPTTQDFKNFLNEFKIEVVAMNGQSYEVS